MTVRLGLAGIAMMVLTAVSAPAVAQDTRELVNRLERMERDLQVMQRQLNRGGAPAPGAQPAPAEAPSSEVLLQYEQRLAAYEEQLRRLTGQLEEANHALGVLARKLEKQMGDVEFRVKTLEDARGGVPGAGAGVGAPPPGAPPSGAAPAPTGQPGQPSTVIIPAPAPAAGQAASGAPAQQAAAPAQRAILPAGSPEDQFKFAFDFLKQNDTQQGERALRAFTETHPKNPLTGNAHFWLGQIYFSNKDFSRAAVAFATSYEKFPDGAKAPDSLVRLGNSLAQLNKKDEACAAYKQLGAQYPTAPPALKQGANTESSRLGCR